MLLSIFRDPKRSRFDVDGSRNGGFNGRHAKFELQPHISADSHKDVGEMIRSKARELAHSVFWESSTQR